MTILKQVIHDTKTNSVEATWEDAEGKQVKCHSYADVQMGMFRADVLALGGNIAEHESMIAAVEAAIVPYVAPPMPNPRIAEIKTRLAQIDIESIRALRAKSIGKGKPADDTALSALDAEANSLRAELAVTPEFNGV